MAAGAITGDGRFMEHMPLRLLADDLTGALDSACAFALLPKPVSVYAEPMASPPWCRDFSSDVAVSTETRDLDMAEAMRVYADIIASMKASSSLPAAWFKKIDSVMRGNPVAETVAIMQAGKFSRCIVAPAFPAQGRITRHGRQFRRAGDGYWRPVGPNLVDAFNSFGLAATVWRDGRAPRVSSQPVIVVDADNAGMLRDRVKMLNESSQETLWVGTGGLAAALNPPRPALAVPSVSLVIVGTNHPATVAQVDDLRRCDRVAVVELGGGAVEIPDGIDTAVLVPARSLDTAAAVGRALNGSLAHLVRSVGSPGGILVTGGETLLRVLRACEAHHIDCIGSLASGVPLGKLRGGIWDGVGVVTKSGGFGSPDLIRTLLASAGRMLPGQSGGSG